MKAEETSRAEEDRKAEESGKAQETWKARGPFMEKSSTDATEREKSPMHPCGYDQASVCRWKTLCGQGSRYANLPADGEDRGYHDADSKAHLKQSLSASSAFVHTINRVAESDAELNVETLLEEARAPKFQEWRGKISSRDNIAPPP